MAAENDPRMMRRQALGDKSGMQARNFSPLPGSPQDQKAGNTMNNPMNADSFGPQVASMDGISRFPYGDMGLPLEDGRMGAVGAVANSNMPQNLVPGRGMNMGAPYNMQPQPDAQQMVLMEPSYMMNQARGLTEPGGINDGKPPSYPITPLGMSGQPANAEPIPGGLPMQTPEQMPDSLPVSGMVSATAAASGMNTGRGGGRNRQN